MVKSGMRCRFGGDLSAESTVRWVSSSLIECTAPSQAEEGIVSVEVSFTDGAVSADRPLAFMYDASIVVEALKPSRGTAEK